MARPRKTTRRKPPQTILRLGNVYAIDWEDHFNTDRVSPDFPDGPLIVRNWGRLIGETETYIKLQYCWRLDNAHHNYFGIIKSCIRKIQDFGPAEAF